MERLQKIIAQSGFCSRRKAEELIIEGRVKVNGKVVTELGTKADVEDIITVDGKSYTVVTSRYGNYNLNVTAGNSGHYVISAVYAGSDMYTSSSNSTYFDVKKTT